MQATNTRPLPRSEFRPINSLKKNPRNARTHSPKQIRKIAESIQAFGFNNPVLIDDEDMIVAGHGRVAAAKYLGMTDVPTLRLTQMNEAQKRAYVIADNRLAQDAGWDEELLAVELDELVDIAPEFDLTTTGFEIAEIDLIIEEKKKGTPTDEIDKLPEACTDQDPTTRPGDLWHLGSHRVLCADATDPQSLSRLLAGAAAQMVFTDPPYNVPISGHVQKRGQTQHDEFPMACGELSSAEFTAFLTAVLKNVHASCADGAIAFVCIDWRHIYELIAAGRDIPLELKNICVWAKTNAGMGTFYRSQHELVAVFKCGSAPHINSFELGQHGRHRTNLWTYAGMNAAGRQRDAALALHPTVKPTALVADAIKDCSKRGGLILDPFLGSGTTLLAAELTGRRAAGLELAPAYVDTIITRWQTHTGQEARLEGSGLTFDEVHKQRATTKG